MKPRMNGYHRNHNHNNHIESVVPYYPSNPTGGHIYQPMNAPPPPVPYLQPPPPPPPPPPPVPQPHPETVAVPVVPTYGIALQNPPLASFGTLALVHIPDGMNIRNALAPGINVQVIGSGFLNPRTENQTQNGGIPALLMPPPSPESGSTSQDNSYQMKLFLTQPQQSLPVVSSNQPQTEQQRYYVFNPVAVGPQAQPFVIQTVPHHLISMSETSTNLNPDAECFYPASTCYQETEMGTGETTDANYYYGPD